MVKQVVVSRSPGNPAVPVVLGMNVLDLPHLLAKYEHSSLRAYDCGLQAVWLRVLQAYEVQLRVAKKQRHQVGVVRKPPQAKTTLGIPVGAHRKLQGPLSWWKQARTLCRQGSGWWVVPCPRSTREEF